MNRNSAVLTWMSHAGVNRAVERLAMTGIVSVGVFLLLRVVGLA